jgi:hypothetical protein
MIGNACYLHGRIHEGIFTVWIPLFISSVKPTADDPAILLTDDYYYHIRNICVISTVRENNVATYATCGKHVTSKIPTIQRKESDTILTILNDDGRRGSILQRSRRPRLDSVCLMQEMCTHTVDSETRHLCAIRIVEMSY